MLRDWAGGSEGLPLCVQGAGWAPAPTMGEAEAEAAQSCWARERPPYWHLARLQAAPALSCPEMFELAACILEMSFLKLTGILFLGNKYVLTQTPPSSAQQPLLLVPLVNACTQLPGECS